jgi:acyl carrier protein
MSEQEIKDRIRAFILEVFYLADPQQLTDDVSLIGSGIVDSTGMLEIILFIESEFGIDVEDRDARPENLETITRIAAFVERKRLVPGPDGQVAVG